MIIKKSFVYLLCAFVLGASLGYSLKEPKRRGFMHPEAKIEMMIQALDEMEIDQARLKQVKELLRSAGERFKVIGKEMRPQIKKIRKDTRAELKKILSEDEFRELRKKMRAKRLAHWKEKEKRWQEKALEEK